MVDSSSLGYYLAAVWWDRLLQFWSFLYSADKRVWMEQSADITEHVHNGFGRPYRSVIRDVGK